MSDSTETKMNEIEEKTSSENAIIDEENLEKITNGKSWSEMKYVPDKKRFTILGIVLTLLEIGMLCIFAFAFPNARDTGLNILGLLLVPPFMGVIVSYFVQDKKEGIAISAVNGLASIIPFMIIHSMIEVFVYSAQLIDVFYFLFPILGLGLQIAVAYTMSRVRRLYRAYGDPDIERESDEAMIAELRESRIKRGLEEPVEDVKEDLVGTTKDNTVSSDSE